MPERNQAIAGDSIPARQNPYGFSQSHPNNARRGGELVVAAENLHPSFDQHADAPLQIAEYYPEGSEGASWMHYPS